jgi:hypothetical protein
VRGIGATGEDVAAAIIRCLEQNGIDIFYLEKEMGDGGSEYSGAIAFLRKHPRARLIVCVWCALHRFYF